MEYSHEEMHATYGLLTNHDNYHWKALGRLEALGVERQEVPRWHNLSHSHFLTSKIEILEAATCWGV